MLLCNDISKVPYSQMQCYLYGTRLRHQSKLVNKQDGGDAVRAATTRREQSRTLGELWLLARRKPVSLTNKDCHISMEVYVTSRSGGNHNRVVGLRVIHPVLTICRTPCDNHVPPASVPHIILSNYPTFEHTSISHYYLLCLIVWSHLVFSCPIV